MSLKYSLLVLLSQSLLAAATPVVLTPRQAASPEVPQGVLILVGGYVKETEVLRFNPFVEPNTLTLASTSDGGNVENKAWLIRHPINPRIVISSNDHAVANATGYITSFVLDENTGALSFVDHKDSGGYQLPGPGVAAAHAAFFPDGKTAGVANYYGQTASTFTFNSTTAKFGHKINNGSILDFGGYTRRDEQIPVSQDTAHPHQITTHPWLPVLYLPDLGEDVLRRFHIGEGGTLSPLEPYPQKLGTGPRHLAISSNGNWLYLLHELAATMSVYKIDTSTSHGDLSLVQEGVPIFPDNATYSLNISTAEVHVSNDGRFLYASNRNLTAAAVIAPSDPSDTITVFSVDQSSGHITHKQSAMLPGSRQIRAMELSPVISTASAGGQDFIVAGGLATNNTFVLKRDKTNGTLSVAATYKNSFGPSTYLWV